MTPPDTFILICDWHGKLTWSSATGLGVQVGECAWEMISESDVSIAKEAFARTATLGEAQLIEVQNKEAQRQRMWLWPLGPPEAAICVLCCKIPAELAQLTKREKDCLGLLAQGMSPKLMAAKLDIGLSTVHTHLKRMRTKLNIPRVEALISFAAKHWQGDIDPSG